MNSNAGASTGKKSTFTGLGIDYNLSKMTAVYLRSESVNDEANAMNAAMTPTAIKGTDNKFERTQLGIRMSF